MGTSIRNKITLLKLNVVFLATYGPTTPNLPVVIYGLGRDGDGVKYALYSSRSTEELIFISLMKEIQKFPRPCLLIAYKKDLTRLQVVLQKNFSLRPRDSSAQKQWPHILLLLKRQRMARLPNNAFKNNGFGYTITGKDNSIHK